MVFLVTEVFGGPNFFIFFSGMNYIYERVTQSKQPSPYPLAVGVIPPVKLLVSLLNLINHVFRSSDVQVLSSVLHLQV